MFNLTKESNILLYGYSKLDFAINKFQELKKAGYRVLGYIDKNADDLKEYLSIPVWKLSELTENMKESIVIIMLQNGRLHPSVAQMLYSVGINKIIYLPQDLKNPVNKVMYDRYNLFLEQDFEKLIDMPLYGEIDNKLHKNSNFQVTEGIYVTRKIPIEFLYVYEEKSTSIKIPIEEEKIYHEMFDYLEGLKAECREYLSFQGVSGESAERLLEDRRGLNLFFSQLNDEDFMIIAPHARWNKDGYFNIIDGLHRAIYQVRRGKKDIFIRIKKEDYIKWYEMSRRKHYG